MKHLVEAEKQRIDEAIETDKACIENNEAVLRDLEREKELTEHNVDELTKTTEKLNEQKEDLSSTVNELADSVQKLQEEKELLEVSKKISESDNTQENDNSVEQEEVVTDEASEDKTSEPVEEEVIEKISAVSS